MSERRFSCARRMRLLPGAAALAAGLLTLSACGGSGQSTASPPPSPPAPVASLQGSVSFGPVTEGVTSAPMTAMLTNTGTATLTFSRDPFLSGANAADFAITGSTCTTASPLAVNADCAVTLTFTPSTTSMESASLNFEDNAVPNTQVVALSGGTGSTVNNVLPVTVDLGPAGVEDVDVLFASITICVPGTSTCQTIDHIQVDTGSSGLRVLASQLSIGLPQATLGGENLGTCVQFVDMTYAWGAVQTGDIVMAGEKAVSQPIQVIAEPGFASVPSTCSNGAPSTDNLDSVLALGANGLIGVGPFRQDCGTACAESAIPGTYYTCPNNSCTPTAIPLVSQLQNPVWMFPQDNNGVLISLPSVPANGDSTVDGSMIFGIGTQANNTLGSAQVYTTDDFGNITATYNGTAYSGSFLDSGSNGLFFLDTPQTGLLDCPMSSNFYGFYCSSGGPFTVTNRGANGVSGQVSFSITDAETLFDNNPSAAAFSNLGGPFNSPDEFDFGLAFFFGRNVFTGIEGQPAGNVTGPFFAF